LGDVLSTFAASPVVSSSSSSTECEESWRTSSRFRGPLVRLVLRERKCLG
jgi:hypothetical protein